MSEEDQIHVSCSTHPRLHKPRLFLVSHRHEYAPPALEADIIQDAEKSTYCFKSRLQALFPSGSDFDANVQGFLANRQNLLETLSNTPEVKSFLNYVLGLESEVEAELEMETEKKAVEEMLEGEVEEPGEEKTKETEITKTSESKGKEYDNLLDAMSHSIKGEKKQNSGESSLQNAIFEYVRSFLDLVDWLVEQRIQIKKYKISLQQLQQLIAEVISCDILLIAEEKDNLGSEKSLVIPLDISPLRISLISLLSGGSSPDVKNWNRMFSPPVFMTWKDNILRLVKPYRSLDKHPIMIRIPKFDRDSERFQEEVERSLRHFHESADPLIDKLKGLTPFGKRGTRPSLIRKYLSGAISCYMDYNPFSIENFRAMDLGCGSGTLLRDSYHKLLENRSESPKQILLYTLLNDKIKDPGKGLRSASENEEFAKKLQLEIREGDMRDLIVDVHARKEHFDMAFVNRVFDIYGGYGIFLFDKKEVPMGDLSQITVDTMEIVPYELENKVIAFCQYTPYSSLWRAFAFLLGQPVESRDENLFLPAVQMDSLNNFFASKGRDGSDLFERLLDTTELVFVSVFPGSFESVFPLNEPQKNKIFAHQVIEPSTYSIIMISKDKSLIDYLTSNL